MSNCCNCYCYILFSCFYIAAKCGDARRAVEIAQLDEEYIVTSKGKEARPVHMCHLWPLEVGNFCLATEEGGAGLHSVECYF